MNNISKESLLNDFRLTVRRGLKFMSFGDYGDAFVCYGKARFIYELLEDYFDYVIEFENISLYKPYDQLCNRLYHLV